MTELTDDEILRRAEEIKRRRVETRALEAFVRAIEKDGASVCIRTEELGSRVVRTLELPDEIVNDVIRQIRRLYARKKLHVPEVTNGD